MIIVIIDNAHSSRKAVSHYASITDAKKIYLAVIRKKDERVENIPKNINFIGDYLSIDDALYDVLSFLNVEDHVLFHVISPVLMDKKTVNDSLTLFELGYSAVFMYSFPFDTIFRNFFYPIVGGCLGRPIPPPSLPFIVNKELYSKEERNLFYNIVFSRAYNLATFIELSTTFEPICGIYHKTNLRILPGAYEHGFSAYLEYFPRWKSYEGEHAIKIIGLDKIKVNKPKNVIDIEGYRNIVENLILGRITFENLKELLEHPFSIEEMEYERVLVQNNKEEIIKAVRRGSKVLF